MIDFVLDYLEDKGVEINSEAEYENISKGIELYLYENGIDKEEKREYFRKFVLRHLSKIEQDCLKQYFSMYPSISQVNQIAIEYIHRGSLPQERVNTLYNLMNSLYLCGLGDKYIPSGEVQDILGNLA